MASSRLRGQLHVPGRGNDEHDAGERAGHLFEHILLEACELRVIVRRRARQNDHSRVVHGGELLHAEASERQFASLRVLERPRAVFVRQKRVRLDGGLRREAVENSNLPPRLHAGKTGRRKDLADAEDGDAHGLVLRSGKGQRVFNIFEQHAASGRGRAADEGVLVHSGCIFHGNLPSMIIS